MMEEKTIHIENKFKKIVADKSRNAFWKEKRNLSKNPVLEALIIKNEHGHRLFNPEEVKEGTASYYQNLYKKKEVVPIRAEPMIRFGRGLGRFPALRELVRLRPICHAIGRFSYFLAFLERF